VGHHFQGQKVKGQLAGAGEYIVADSRTSLIFINSLIFMAPTAIESKARWGAAGVRDGLQQLGRSVRRTAGGAYCVATRTDRLFNNPHINTVE